MINHFAYFTLKRILFSPAKEPNQKEPNSLLKILSMQTIRQFCSNLVEFIQLLIDHFARFGMEVHTGNSNHTEKPPKTEVLFVSAPSSTYTDPLTYDNRDLDHIQLAGNRYLPVVKSFAIWVPYLAVLVRMMVM